MRFDGPLRKMTTSFDTTIRYRLKLGEDFLLMNGLIGRTLRMNFKGEHTCFCGQLVPEVYRQNFCRECFFTKPETSPTIMKPELSQAHLGIEERDLEYEKKVQLQPHVVYLAKTDRIKVGVTRHTQVPTRWMDQGAAQAIEVLRTENRYLAGQAEVLLKEHFTDKTSWRAMLKGTSTEESLPEAKDRALSLLPEEFQGMASPDGQLWDMKYPGTYELDKVNSLSFKEPGQQWEGKLLGIRGQYLITTSGVFNVRSHGGFMITLEVL
jgi:hypothetical protein